MSNIFSETITKVGTAITNKLNAAISAHDSSSSAHSTEMAKKINKTSNNTNLLLADGTNIPQSTFNNYTHPNDLNTTKTSGMYKVALNAKGHVTSATAVEKSDITGLGIPSSDTVYSHPQTQQCTHNHSGTYVDGVTGKNTTNGSALAEVKANTTVKGTVYHPKVNSSALTGVPTANKSPSFGGSFTVSQPSVNTDGHVTGLASRTITLPSLPSTMTPSSHTHGDITNAGTIGSTANLPLITTTDGKIATGSFGTSANTFCEGNDSRLSDARTPTSHTHTKSQITDFPTIPDVSNYATLSQVEEASAKSDSKQNQLIAGTNISLTDISELPSGYTQLDYIVGSQNQYIDTEWKFSNTYPVKFDCKFMPYSVSGTSGYAIPYGLQATNFSKWIYVFYMGNGFSLHLGGSSNIDSIPVVINSIYDTSFTITNSTSWSRTINGQTTTGSYSGAIDTTSNMYLMGGSYGSQPINLMSGRIYSFKITVNNTVVRNYIPARRNSDSAVGMYDLATSTFKASDSGTSFGAGNPVLKTNISVSGMSTVPVVVTYSDNSTETLILYKQTIS